ncbi:MAG: DUF5670 family protein [Armatimonadota bacterium]|nr:DUF5670 family protein [Armatimonadota bacterium]
MLSLLWTIIVILFIFWIVGLGLNWSSWIWTLFVVALVLLIYNVFAGRRVV